MKKLLSVTLLLIFLGFNFTLPESSAQDVLTSEIASVVDSVKSSEVVSTVETVKTVVAVNKVDIPEWAGSVIVFLKGAPVVGPYLVKILSYMGMIAAFLTLVSSLLMALSGFLAVLSKGKSSRSWIRKAKKYLDWGTQYAKYLSMFNTQKDEKKKS